MHQYGYTIIELLFVIALLGGLAAWQIPIWQRATEKYQTLQQLHWLKQRLTEARALAISHHETISICLNQNSRFCRKLTRPALYNTSGNIVQIIPPKPQIKYRVSGHETTPKFYPNGTMNSRNGSFVYCLNKKHCGLALVVNRVGRARITTNKQTSLCNEQN